MKQFKDDQGGFIIAGLIGLMIAFGILVGVAGTLVGATLGSASKNQGSQKAMNIAEAGVNYYLWHMSHNATDYKDGKTTPASPDPDLGYGPYVHSYKDSSGKVIGSFTLYIKPGANGSNVATVRSIGKVVSDDNLARTLQVKIGAPSFSTYSVVSNSELWFGDTELADGPVHSNVGVKMDGPNNSDVTSSNSSYVPSTSGPGSGSTKPGVWCDPLITNPNCSNRSKVSWRYPVASIDFNKLSADLCQLKKAATNDQTATSCTKKPARTAGYLPSRNNSFSVFVGYLITLNNDGTYNLSNVNNEIDTQSSYTTALSTSVIQNNIAIPSSGVIFVEDNVWVRSASNGFDGRVTIASARLAVNGSTTATIVDNLLYKDKYTGNDTIGIIAENDIEIAPYVPVPLTIHAALIAQSGRVQFRPNYNYTGNDTPGYINSNQNLSFFGSAASNEQWTWSWIRCGSNISSCWSGFKNNETTYDENLRYSPPPNFPVTSTFDILEWREVLANP